MVESECLFLGLFAEPIFIWAPPGLGVSFVAGSQSHFFGRVSRFCSRPNREAIHTSPPQRLFAALLHNHHSNLMISAFIVKMDDLRIDFI